MFLSVYCEHENPVLGFFDGAMLHLFRPQNLQIYTSRALMSGRGSPTNLRVLLKLLRLVYSI